MSKQVSTALSDLVLALSAVWGFRMLHETRRHDYQFGKWWFMLETLAASLGVVKFGGLLPNYHASVVRYHKNFSWLCRAIGIPCLAAELCRLNDFGMVAQGFLFSAVATFITSSVKSAQKERVTLLVNALSIIAILVLGVISSSVNLLAAGVLFVLSAIVGDEGHVKALNMPRVDVLHYILVAVNYFIVWGMKE
ncbi:uncharacterized protein [Macrobrachium rosenbergii]|uniref:uncharacterized protein n=1 Tax=Macrobrachium rosenbergii TaxID=79674 RepID=UPI0034D3CF13